MYGGIRIRTLPGFTQRSLRNHSLAPTLAWLALANPVGITQALWNRDAFWKAGPFMQPDRRWLK